MKALILAAGTASRLRPLTNNTPKCLLEIGGHCLLQRAIDNLAACDISQFVIVTGYLQEQIVSFVNQNYPQYSFTFIHNERYASTNNIYSLWLAKNAMLDDDMLLLDSDILFEQAIVQTMIESPYANALALNNHPLGEEEMKVVVDNSGRIVEISKTCRPDDALGESMGIEKMSKTYQKALFAELDEMITKEGLDNIFYERAFERLIPQGFSFNVVDITSYFSMELDTVEDFEQAKLNFKS